jgi:hypothetical protein
MKDNPTTMGREKYILFVHDMQLYHSQKAVSDPDYQVFSGPLATIIGIGGRETAPLPHHRACGSAPGGSVKYDEVDIVPKS